MGTRELADRSTPTTKNFEETTMNTPAWLDTDNLSPETTQIIQLAVKTQGRLDTIESTPDLPNKLTKGRSETERLRGQITAYINVLEILTGQKGIIKIRQLIHRYQNEQNKA